MSGRARQRLARVLTWAALLAAWAGVVGAQSTRITHEEAARRLRLLEERLADAPENTQILYNLGAGYWWLMADHARAEGYYRRLLAVEPALEGGWFDLGQIQEDRGHYAAAAESYRRFLALYDEDDDQTAYAKNYLSAWDAIACVAVAPEAAWRADDRTATNSLGMQFVRIDGGSFTMGTDTGANDARPAHVITLSPYWIGAYEVTAGQLQSYLEETGRTPAIPPVNDRAPGASYPAVFVSWNEARHFAMWLSKKEGAVYRLPTEAEWERAARAIGEGADTGPERVAADGPAPLRPVGTSERDRTPEEIHGLAGNARNGALTGCRDFYHGRRRRIRSARPSPEPARACCAVATQRAAGRPVALVAAVLRPSRGWGSAFGWCAMAIRRRPTPSRPPSGPSRGHDSCTDCSMFCWRSGAVCW